MRSTSGMSRSEQLAVEREEYADAALGEASRHPERFADNMPACD